MSINILDSNTISKIAAGEVIENPASVVKELIENSIDASAKHIVIEIQDAGLKSIKVTDDGVGFEKDDIELAFLQHATSKINNINDLESIMTFGFRGEALASISSVSKITLTTKNKNTNSSYGLRYCIDFGNKSSIEETASNFGTCINVEDLFKNVPVRKKFLKSSNKENALIEDIVIKFALVRDDIAFELYIDGKKKFFSNGDSNILNVIYNLYGKDIVNNLLPIEDVFDGIKVSGYIAKPIIARNTRNDEIFFVNNRYIKDKTISRAIEAAYEEYLMQHKYPLVILKVDVDGTSVDVNVHPKKMEVRFSNEERIYYSIYNTISKCLKNESLIHEEKFEDIKIFDYDTFDNNYENEKATIEYNKEDEIKKTLDVEALPRMSSIFKKSFNEGINISNLYQKLSKKYEEQSFIQKTLTENHKYIGQVFNTYILVEFNEKLYIIDQHAACEKINFERIMSEFKNGKVLNQKIFPSIVLTLTPIQYEAVINNIDEFNKIGYEIESFGNNDIKVSSVPYYIYNISSEKLLMDMIDSFADNKNKETYDSVEEKIASISCKKAIKANYILSEDEVKQLLKDLFSLDNPYNCPHGRPTIISLSKYEFEKRFGRII